MPEQSTDPLLAELHELTDLPDGWRFREGVPLHPSVVDQVRNLAQTFACLRLKTRLFPYVDGSLLVVFYSHDCEQCVEIDITQPAGEMGGLCVEEGRGRCWQEIKSITNPSIEEVRSHLQQLASASG